MQRHFRYQYLNRNSKYACLKLTKFLNGTLAHCHYGSTDASAAPWQFAMDQFSQLPKERASVGEIALHELAKFMEIFEFQVQNQQFQMKWTVGICL